ncbi:MAG: DUF881 domain-containing protein [Clostridia bacterium]
MKRKYIIFITILCFLSGLLSVGLYNTQKNTNSINAYARQDDAVFIVEQMETRINKSQNTLDDLRTKILATQEAQVKDQTQTSTLTDKLTSARVYAGLTAVKGSGLKITINDNLSGAEVAKKNSDILTYRPEDYILHDKDLLYFFYMLRSLGAEAISLASEDGTMEQRMILSGNIRCIGPVVLVNTMRMAPPFVFKVIGDPVSLSAKIIASEEYQYLQQKEFPIKIEKISGLTIAPYKANILSTYAKTNNKTN